ncbi:MAG: biotin synthase BioB [Pseudomonadota bacterium]
MSLFQFASNRVTWETADIDYLFQQPFNDLLFAAHQMHRVHHDVNQIQLSRLLSIKTGACPEDCKYCSQSGHYNTNLEKEKLIAIEKVLESAKAAKEQGATRFCMGAAWRSPQDRDLSVVIKMIRGVKALGLESCATLGMLSNEQAQTLAAAGLDYYNHNLDTSAEHYASIITTRSYEDRLETLRLVRDAGMKICCGGILGLGESRFDRIRLLEQLANLNPYPESVPINQLVPIPGTPLENAPPVDVFEFIRTVAIARLIMPKAVLRLSAGRETFDDAAQALCFFAGANSIFFGEQLLTTDNPATDRDAHLFQRLGLTSVVLESSNSIQNTKYDLAYPA